MNYLVGSIFTTGLMAFALAGCNEEKTEQNTPVSKSVIVYYSQTGTTKALAEEFERLIDVEESIELTLTDPYPSNYDSTIVRVRGERENKKWPSLEKARLDLAKYDTVYLGYPIMFGTFAPPIYTFLDSNDLSGKVVVPFCTYGSGGRKASIRELSTLEPNAKVTLSFGISHKRVGDLAVDVTKEVKTFLNDMKASKTEEMLNSGYTEMRPLKAEDMAIFKEATTDYGYLNLKALSVATQGDSLLNYLFTCEMNSFGGPLEKVVVKVFKPRSTEGSAQMLGVEKL